MRAKRLRCSWYLANNPSHSILVNLAPQPQVRMIEQ
jgi:hypothetical protein